MDDGRAKNTSGDTGAPGDLLGALLSDGQLLERVSQIVAKTRAVESSAAGNDTAPPDSSHSNAPPPPVPDLNLLTALFGGMPASPTQDADDNPAVQDGSDAAGKSGINASAAGASGTSGTSGTSGASGAPDTSATPRAAEANDVNKANEATAASAASSSAPPDRLAGLTSLLTDSDFMAKLPGVLSMLSSGGGGSAGSGGKDGSNGGSDGRDGGKSGKDGKSVPVGARGGHGGGRGDGDRCIALLSALKPYMSPRRCEAIDYLIRMNRMGDIIRRIR